MANVRAYMENANLNTALTDLVDAIRGITLGSVETTVIQAAGEELIRNWNDHNPGDVIDEAGELYAWQQMCKEDLQKN
jgi:hypothetical protein